MMKTSYLVVSVAAILITVCGGCTGAARSMTLTRPHRHVRVAVLADQPRLRYNVSLDKDVIIETSPLVFTVDGVDLTDGATIEKTQSEQANDTYDTRGVHSKASDHYRGEKISLRHAKSK